AIGERNHLRPINGLALLLDAGMQEADVRLRLHDGLAFEFDDDAQNAVRRGVLRPHVERHPPRSSGARRRFLGRGDGGYMIFEGLFHTILSRTRTYNRAPDSLY